MDRLTKLQIIEETVEYYKTHKRATVIGNQCTYFYRNAKCAVGRCMINPKQFKGDYETTAFNLEENYHDRGGLDFLLQDKYKGHNIDFWMDLQRLHDSESYWWREDNKNRLSYSGRNFVEKIKNKKYAKPNIP